MATADIDPKKQTLEQFLESSGINASCKEYREKYGYDLFPMGSRYAHLIDRVLYAKDESYRLEVKHMYERTMEMDKVVPVTLEKIDFEDRLYNPHKYFIYPRTGRGKTHEEIEREFVRRF